MLPHERRWAQAIMEAFAPVGGEGLAPKSGEVDYVGWLETVIANATPLAAVGVRGALYAINGAPLVLERRRVQFSSLPLEERTRMLDSILSSEDFALRELALLLKIQASAALFASSAVRARSNYDRDRGAPYSLPVLGSKVS